MLTLSKVENPTYNAVSPNDFPPTVIISGLLGTVGMARHQVFLAFISIVVEPCLGPSKIAKPTIFHVVLRDIGKSFQLAITASRLDLIDYGNATAQS